MIAPGRGKVWRCSLRRELGRQDVGMRGRSGLRPRGDSIAESVTRVQLDY